MRITEKRTVFVIRSVVAVVIGTMIISTTLESIEYSLSVAWNNPPITGGGHAEWAAELQTRRPFQLAMVFYSGLVALLGGIVAARIAGYWGFEHGLFMAVVQIIAIAWSEAGSVFADESSFWTWFELSVVMALMIIVGVAVVGKQAK